MGTYMFWHVYHLECSKTVYALELSNTHPQSTLSQSELVKYKMWRNYNFSFPASFSHAEGSAQCWLEDHRTCCLYLNIKKHGSIKSELALENKGMMLNNVAVDILSISVRLSDCNVLWIKHATEKKCFRWFTLVSYKLATFILRLAGRSVLHSIERFEQQNMDIANIITNHLLTLVCFCISQNFGSLVVLLMYIVYIYTFIPQLKWMFYQMKNLLS